MQDFDTLRNRVEATAQKLTSARSERQEQTDTLIGILRQLEERYAAQEQQVVYYKNRVEPLQLANEQLSHLMADLLDMIDTGFGEASLVPMRKAFDMATSMLATDMAPEPEMEAADNLEAEEDRPPESVAQAETETGSDMPADMVEADLAPEVEPEAAESVIEEPEEATDFDSAEADAVAATDDEEIVGPTSVATDLEMEEESLARLEKDIDPAAEVVPPPVEMAEDMPEAAELEAPESDSLEAVASDEPSEADAMTIEEIVSDAEMAEMGATAEADERVQFEDVSAATLEFEQEEDAAAGLDDLPEVVQIAAAAAQGGDRALDPPEEPPAEAVSRIAEAKDTEIEMEGSGDAETAADEADAIAAIAQAIEDESSAENGSPPAPADIRSLLLRVEALAKKAEAMRMSQGAPEQAARDESVSGEPGASAEEEKKHSGAAA